MFTIVAHESTMSSVRTKCLCLRQCRRHFERGVDYHDRLRTSTLRDSMRCMAHIQQCLPESSMLLGQLCSGTPDSSWCTAGKPGMPRGLRWDPGSAEWGRERLGHSIPCWRGCCNANTIPRAHTTLHLRRNNVAFQGSVS